MSDLADGRAEEEPWILGGLGFGAAPRCDLVGVAARVEPDADDVHGVGNGWQQFHGVEGDVGVVAAVGASGLGSELEERARRDGTPIRAVRSTIPPSTTRPAWGPALVANETRRTGVLRLKGLNS